MVDTKDKWSISDELRKLWAENFEPGLSLHRLPEGISELVVKDRWHAEKQGRSRRALQGRASLTQNVLLELPSSQERNKLRVIHIFVNLDLVMPSTGPLSIVCQGCCFLVFGFFFFVCLFVCLFVLSRLHAQGGAQCGVWTHNPEVKTWTEIKSWMFNRLSHPSAPFWVFVCMCWGKLSLISFNSQPMINVW